MHADDAHVGAQNERHHCRVAPQWHVQMGATGYEDAGVVSTSIADAISTSLIGDDQVQGRSRRAQAFIRRHGCHLGAARP